jgi:hypothetical protein
MRKLTRRTATVAAAMAAATGVGVAYAAWTSNGSGTGQAVTRTSVDSVISPSADGVSLYPGATSSFQVSVTNPNDYPVTVLTISSGSSNEVNGCAAGSVLSDASAPGTDIAPNSSATFTLTSHMVADPSNACKSQTFTLPLTATLQSHAS